MKGFRRFLTVLLALVMVFGNASIALAHDYEEYEELIPYRYVYGGYTIETEHFKIDALTNNDKGWIVTMFIGSHVNLTIYPKSDNILITSIDAIVAGAGGNYSQVRCSSGTKVQTGAVSDGSHVQVVDINSNRFVYSMNSEAGIFFKDIKVHYIIHDKHIYDRETINPKYLKDNATCTTPEIYYKSCICGEKSTSETFMARGALGHDEEIDEAKLPTCTETGLTEGRHCKRCEEVLVEQQTIPATGHDKAKFWSTDETSHWRKCLTCGANTDVEDHNSSGPATEDAAEVCTICGYVINPPVEHEHINNLTEVPEGGASCTEVGNLPYYECRCGAWFWDADAKEPIVDKGSVYKKLMHNDIILEAKEPTCTDKGLTEGHMCDACNQTFVEQVEIPALGHMKVIDEAKEPTCTEDGLTSGSHCGRCSEVFVEQEVIPAKGHMEIIDEAKEPTCTEDGYTNGRHCGRCGEIFEKQDVIPAKGHVDADDNKYCDVCDTYLSDKLTVALSTKVYTYDEKAKSPALTVTDVNNNKLIKGTDYTVAMPTNGRTSVGLHTYTVNFIGKYSGSKTVSFKINPATASVKSITSGTRKMTVKMTTKPSAKGASAYQIWYKKKGSSTWKKTTTTAQSKTIKSLKKGKCYYVKVRAYKKVNGTSYYGKWSRVKLSRKIK